ncbi:MAG TPA: hypothetical protein VIL01_11080 [Thermomicrobiales bacterium]
MSPWLVFALSGAVVVFAGIRLSRDSDTIAERTGLGGAWIGATLVASTTSLPELITDIYAVRQGTAPLAIGGLFGSNMSTMAILALADLTMRRRRLLMRIAINQALVGVIAICLTATIAAGVMTGDALTFGPLGWATVLAAFGYVAGIWLLHINRRPPPFTTQAEAEEAARTAPSLRRAVIGFSVAALAILIAGRPLARSAADIADELGVSTGVVGVAFLAVLTTLPELTVTFESVRRHAYDLAIGNLMGSVSFNMVIFLPLDLADGKGSVLAHGGPDAVVAALFAILLIGQTAVEVLNKAEHRIWFLEPDAALRLVTYALGIYLVTSVG